MIGFLTVCTILFTWYTYACIVSREGPSYMSKIVWILMFLYMTCYLLIGCAYPPTSQKEVEISTTIPPPPPPLLHKENPCPDTIDIQEMHAADGTYYLVVIKDASMIELHHNADPSSAISFFDKNIILIIKKGDKHGDE